LVLHQKSTTNSKAPDGGQCGHHEVEFAHEKHRKGWRTTLKCPAPVAVILAVLLIGAYVLLKLNGG